VGVNKHQTDDPIAIDLLRIDPEGEQRQIASVQAARATRDVAAWKAAMEAVRAAATGDANLVPPIIAAVEAHATLGEIADSLRQVFGEYRDNHA
jgi:methylmalonyl-CoA mutase N-terminal domain/subunit